MALDVDEQFSCKVLPDRERVVVSLVGELDLATSPQVSQTLDDLLRAGFSKITIDLKGLRFMDSSGLHLLMDTAKQAQRARCELTLVQGSRAVRRAFELTGLDSAFKFETGWLKA